MKTGGGFHFVILLTPHDNYEVRAHHQCEKAAIQDGYRRLPIDAG